MLKMIGKIFSNSETIVFARLQVVIGGLLTAGVANGDAISQVLPPNLLPWWMVGSGVITEVLRRLRDPKMSGMGANGSETIWWARIQIVAGVLLSSNLAPIIPLAWLPWYTLINGVVTEIARRMREPKYSLGG